MIARAGIAADAGLIDSAHPHEIRGIERHDGVPIFDPLGNFALHWEKMRGRHRDGLLVRCLVEEGRVIEAAVVRVRRNAHHDIGILDPRDPDGTTVFQPRSKLSKALGTELKLHGRHDGGAACGPPQRWVELMHKMGIYWLCRQRRLIFPSVLRRGLGPVRAIPRLA